jgi:ParB-like chromosome segregation protein Spo0J
MNEWPADKITKRKTDELIPYARNSRTHSDEQVAQIAASIKEWGWTTPVLIDESGGIIAGHGRVMAARKLGIEEVPTMTATGWTKAQKAAYVLADNQLPQNAGWNMDMLKVEMMDLDTNGFDLSLIGFDDAELGALFEGLPTEGANEIKGKLSDRFGIAPFSVLNAREGWWQDRKRAWLSIGIQSEIGRGGGKDGKG